MMIKAHVTYDGRTRIKSQQPDLNIRACREVYYVARVLL